MRWATAATALTILAAAAVPASAGAATVVLDQSAPPDAVATVTAAPGEANRLTLTRPPGTSTALVVRDASAPLTPGAGCAATAPGEVTCTPMVGLVAAVKVDAGDGDDTVDASALAGASLTADGGPGDDLLRGGPASDLLRPGLGRDVVDGGGDLDTVFYDDRTKPVTIDLSGEQPSGEAGEGDTIINVENAFGGDGDDTLTGQDGPNLLAGGAGDDGIGGADGDDALVGGPGRDAIDGGNGDDVLSGDGGRDFLTGEAGDDHLAGGGGADVLLGDDGDDTLDLTGDPAQTRGEIADCGAGRHDRVDSPAGFETVLPECERIDIAVRGEDVQPLRLHGLPTIHGRTITLRVTCDPDDCGDRTRLRVTLRPTSGADRRPRHATATLRPGHSTTLRFRRGTLARDRFVDVSVTGTQVEDGDGVPVRGGFGGALR